MNKKRIILLILIIIWMITVFWLSSDNANKSSQKSGTITKFIVEIFNKNKTEEEIIKKVENLQHLVRKGAHLTLYTIGGILYFAFFNTYDILIKKKILFSVLCGSLYAMTDEIHQSFVPGRGPQITDVMIDTAGILIRGRNQYYNIKNVFGGKMENSEIVKKAQAIIVNEIKDLDAIILFGSYSRGKQKPTSDIDIAVKTLQPINPMELINTKNKIEEEIGIDVHLIDLNAINEDFRYEILISGKTLFAKDEYELEMYKLKAYSDYLMFSEDREPIINKIKNGGTLYGK